MDTLIGDDQDPEEWDLKGLNEILLPAIPLDLLLRLLNGIGKHLMLNLFILRHSEGIKNTHQRRKTS